MMGILKMVDYTRGSHNVYKERYTDSALWQKEFDADIRFWLKFNADWYESVILSKENMTIDMKSINWDTLRYACCFYPLSIFKSTPTSNAEGMGRK
jgi:hypothetical protein